MELNILRRILVGSLWWWHTLLCTFGQNISYGLVEARETTKEVYGLAYEIVELKCVVDEDSCGPIHSIKWYKNNKRVYIYGEDGNGHVMVSRSEGDLEARAQLTLLTNIGNRSLAVLAIDPLLTPDEDLYSCEITYIKPKVQCRILQSIQLRTLAKPQTMQIQIQNESNYEDVANRSIIGPFNEGTILSLLCTSKGGKPVPELNWYNSDNLSQALRSIYRTRLQDHLSGVASSQITIALRRTDHGERLECRDKSSIAGTPVMNSELYIDVHYKPWVSISPTNVTVNETTDILIHCDVDANPSSLISVRWFRNNEPIDASDTEHYSGGTLDEPGLLIKNSKGEDSGIYFAVVQNVIGETTSSTKSYVNVLTKPSVVLSMDPQSPVREQDATNVTLSCDVMDGNPKLLDSVRWYLDGFLLKELPECPSIYYNEEAGYIDEVCDIDPTKLMLSSVTRGFEGAYTCAGRNAAGWGKLSPPTKLYIYYPPGPAQISYEPPIVSKGGVLDLSCSVEELGNPQATKYRWFRNNHEEGVMSVNWRILPVSLETRAGFSCGAVNEAGVGELAPSVRINVLAPPSFISGLPGYTGVAWNTKEVSMSCQVECDPICSIKWMRNGIPIQSLSDTEHMFGSDELSVYYDIQSTELGPDPSKNQFQSILSVLTFKLSEWPDRTMNRDTDNASYTCYSTGNNVGSGVSSSTDFRVEYSPANDTSTSDSLADNTNQLLEALRNSPRDETIISPVVEELVESKPPKEISYQSYFTVSYVTSSTFVIGLEEQSDN